MYDEITYPFPNFNSCTIEVWEWISNFIPHFTGYVITQKQISVKFQTKYEHFNSGKSTWKFCLWNGGHFAAVSMC